jgi:hypothetical protein
MAIVSKRFYMGGDTAMTHIHDLARRAGIPRIPDDVHALSGHETDIHVVE